MVEMAAENVEGGSIANCGHFVPEESPDEIVRHVLAMRKKFATPLYPFVHNQAWKTVSILRLSGRHPESW
jgi:hypothetical protein